MNAYIGPLTLLAIIALAVLCLCIGYAAGKETGIRMGREILAACGYERLQVQIAMLLNAAKPIISGKINSETVCELRHVVNQVRIGK